MEYSAELFAALCLIFLITPFNILSFSDTKRNLFIISCNLKHSGKWKVVQTIICSLWYLRAQRCIFVLCKEGDGLFLPSWMRSEWNMLAQWEQKQQHKQVWWTGSGHVFSSSPRSSGSPACFFPLLLGYLFKMFSMVNGNFCLSIFMNPSIFFLKKIPWNQK